VPQPELDLASDEAPTFWFDDPVADDRQSWAMPAGHGSYRGLEVELLDPGDEDELILLLDAQHAELADAVDSGQAMIVKGEPFSPRLHLVMHQIVANQLLVDEPPETWQTVRRLAGMGYDWHNVMHLIARLISDDVYGGGQGETGDRPGRLRTTLAATTRRLAATAGRRTALT
jgi:hypothetical protein